MKAEKNRIESKSVGIWIRVSTEDQANGESPQHHEKRARYYVESKGWTIREVYDLSGVSGKTVMQHPEAKRMLGDVRRGHITGLVFSKLARLARNKKELHEFADFFRDHNADLVSLQESLDTSTPAGRLFYSILAAMAEWEREEIADRVNASIKIRAQLGKNLGGAAPFGYRWNNNRLVVDPTEAPIRKQMYELFAEHKRYKGVARLLNESGYRTRKGAKFTDTTVIRLIQDSTAKGIYRANHTYRDANGKLCAKPKDQWIMTPVEAIVTEELWNQCNEVLERNGNKRNMQGPKPVHLFAGILWCGCGQKMYVFSRTPKYVCSKCRTKIPIEDIEAIFREQLHQFFVSRDEVSRHLESANEHLTERQNILEAHVRQLDKVKAEMTRTYRLYQDEQISSQGFGKIYRPLEEREQQLSEELPMLQAEVDSLRITQLSADEVVAEATTLHQSWPRLTPEEKRRIIESITEKVIVTPDSIDITLCCLPSSEEFTKRQRTLSGSWRPQA